MNNFHMREGKVEFRWKRWRNKKRQEVSSCLMVLFSGAVLLGAGGVALAGPTGGQVTGGQGTITTPDGTTTNINQQSNVLSINWQDFSIQQGETVNFYQPGSTSIAINRVVGGVPSYLAGALNANGRVFILNSAGITFTGTSQVNVGALLATTAMTVNGDPTQAASYTGSGYGAVINQGSISVSNGGFAILAAPYVQNTGFIKADLGTIALAGTNQFTLDLSGTGLINFVVPAGAVEKIVSDGKAVGVDNAGTLQARSGQVLISANVASEVVNAVVNLNGIVDADAFAPNGQGGAVLVAAAGDINVGGQVTARGDGTGAGGQIVTKAVETDNIEQMAFVSAAGGTNGGIGGHIEVSGKTVGLNGAIDPGKGGLLYVDPATFTIRNGLNTQSASGIGEHRLEALLQNGAGFSVDVFGNITIQDLSDNVLAGGGGDLTLHAGTGGAGNIIVQGVGDTIRTGGGDVTLTAAGNIGDFSHALSFVSGGANLLGVSQAGDIILTATNGGNIYVNSVTERSAGPGTRHALFSANAAGVFSAEGLIDVEVRDSGVGTQSADAEVHIVANQIRLAGLTVLANATKASSSGGPNAGGNAFANAIVTLNARQAASDDGAMTVAASVAGSSGLRFHANAELIVNEQTGFFVKGGPISVMARANVFSAGSTGVHDNAVLADAGLKVNGNGAVEIDSLGVHATALGDKVANDVASAHVDLNGTDINIFGDATVTANGQGGPDVNGVALVVAQATMNATGNAVDLSSNVTVTAEANNIDVGRGAAAEADLRLVAKSQTVTVGGNITVNALALNGDSSLAAANAILNVTGDQGVAIDGDVSVIANGQTLAEAGTDLATPRATASANIFSRNGDIHIGGNLDVEASADDENLDSVRAHARAHIVASGSDFQSISIDGFTKVTANAKTNAQNVFNSGSPHGASATASLMIHAEGHVFLGNDVTVKASASDLGRFQANALANVSITATASTGEGSPLPAGSISIVGNVDVEANAHDPVGNGALANAQFFASGFEGVQIGFAGSDGSPAVEGNLTVAALADNGGLGNASAIGVALLTGKLGPVGVFGNVSVTATAHDAGGGNAFASAFANFSGSGSGGRPGVEIGGSSFSGASVGGHVDVKANAVEENGAAAIAVAGASFDATSGQSGGGVAIHNGINVVADAHNDGTEANHMAASANAQLDFFTREVDVNGAMSITAHATNSGFGQVKALGAVNFGSARTISLNDVTIDVKALNLGSNGSGGAKASANFIETNSSVTLTLDSLNLQAQASTHGGGNAIANAIARITQSSLSISGDVTINALAFRSDPPAASGSANALASLDLRASTNDLHVGGNIKVTANAVDQNNGLAQANAHALLASNSTVHVDGSILVSALASAQGKANAIAANANAQLIFEDASSIIVGGNMSIIAHGTNHGQGKVLASGGVDFGPSAGTVTLSNVLIDVRALNLGAGGSGGARANAIFTDDSSFSLTVDSLNVQAQASSFGAGNAHALASVNIVQSSGLTIGGDVTVNALAVAHGGGNALAQANLLLTASSSGDLTVSGDIDVHANANGFGVGRAQANAIASLTAGSSGGLVNLGGVNVIANALHSGAGAGALALAQLTIDPGTVTISSDVNVKASANNLNGFAGGLAASAKAVFTVSASSAITITGDVSVLAHATNHGKGRVLAQGSVDISSASTIDLAGVTIDVAALNIGTGSNAGTGGAIANAIFHAGSSANLSLGALNLQAQASSLGGGNALALASGNITQSHVVIDGDVTVNALAVSHGGGGNAVAVANLLLTATSGSLSVSGDIDVHANANAAGAGEAQANAIALLNASSSEGGGADIHTDNINVIANALHSGAGGPALALAQLTINPHGSDASISGAVNVKASANNLGGRTGAIAASANALFSIPSAQSIHVSSDISVVAHATNNGKGRVLAQGNIQFDSSASTINLAGVTIDVAALNKNSQGTGGAIANAIFLVNGSSINLHIDALNLQAQANSAGVGNAIALASGKINDSQIQMSGALTVNAAAFAQNGNAQASAIASLAATTGSISVDSVHVTASAVDNGNGAAKALAEMTFDPSFVHVTGDLIVHANASHSGPASPGGLGASANANLNFLNTARIEVDGLMSIAAHGTNHGAGRVNAFGNVNFGTATSLDLQGVVVDVRARNLGSGVGGARAVATFTPAGAATVTINSLNLQAQATSHGTGNAFASANGQLIQGTLSITGDITVNAVAVSNNDNASALANLRLSASTGSLTLGGNVEVRAAASGNGGDVLANALTFLQAQDGVTIGGNIEADALANGGSQADGNVWALTDLRVDALSGSISIGGNVEMDANAQHPNSGDGGAGALAYGAITADDGVRVNGNISVTAELKSNAVNTGSTSIGGQFAPDKLVLGFDLAKLLVDNLATGDVSIGGGVKVVANAEFGNPDLSANVFARGSAVIETMSGDVAIGGPVLVQGNAKSAGNASGTVFGTAIAHISVLGDSGSVHIGNVTVEATASATGANAGQQACAFGDMEISAGGTSGDVSAGLLSERVEAVYLGSHANDAFASANMFVTAAGGNIHIQGARMLADADVLESGGDATAKAEMRLAAGSSIDVGAGGLFADADAFAANGGHADANALIAVDAGQDGIGGVFIHGNAIVMARAIGGDTGNTALANVHLAGGGATELGTGASGIFGNVAVIGNIQAFAAADSLHDHANASVEIFAHNNILIIGDDPIASARLGPNGSLVAFRQAHFTTNQSVTGTQGTATADIDIRAGDQVLVFTPSSLEHVEKLLAMPTDIPTLNSSGGLTIIPLSIIGDDCGVLGQAGATPAQVDKAKACHKGPINVSDLTDALP